MKEARIYARPHQALSAWQAFRVGKAIVFYGLNAQSEQVGTGEIHSLDSDKQCVTSGDDTVWHISAAKVYGQHIEDCTSEVLGLMAEPRCRRETVPFPIVSEPVIL